MARTSYVSYNCQICGRRTRIQGTRPMRCEACNRAMCGSCKAATGIDTQCFNRLPQHDQDMINQRMKTQKVVLGSFCGILGIMLIVGFMYFEVLMVTFAGFCIFSCVAIGFEAGTKKMIKGMIPDMDQGGGGYSNQGQPSSGGPAWSNQQPAYGNQSYNTPAYGNQPSYNAPASSSSGPIQCPFCGHDISNASGNVCPVCNQSF
jgi:hypothetical protein